MFPVVPEGIRSLLAMNIYCIKDLNEITSHMLEVVNAHMQLFGKVLHPRYDGQSIIADISFYNNKYFFFFIYACLSFSLVM